jgi:branched-subunit amino acid transport protein AzlD
MARILPLIILGLLMIYCVIEVAQADPARVRVAPRWLWAVAVIALPGVGSLAWLFFGRPTNRAIPPPPGPRAPDDDPDWLRKLR